MAEEQRTGTGYPEGVTGPVQTGNGPTTAIPAENAAQANMTAGQPETAQTTVNTQAQTLPPVPVEQVTVTVAQEAEDETAETGKKSHRHGAKYKKAGGDEPLAEEWAPKRKLSTKRGLIRFLFFTVITCGIYTLFFVAGLAEDMNLLASRHDGKRTPNLLLLPFITVLTLGIGYFVYWHRFAARIREELWRRRIDYEFGPGKFWGWGVLGTLLIGIGPLIFFHKLCVAMNEMSADYNLHG